MNIDTALIVIDMQRGIQQWDGRPRNNPDAALRILELLKVWRLVGGPIVHVRHVSRDPESVFAPGQPGALFHPDLEPQPNEAVFEKNVTDAFAHTGLERWLHVRGFSRIALTGVATENSVESTARTAGCLGFEAWVVDDACFTFAKSDYRGRARSAEDVHDMALANLHGEFAQVTDCRRLLQVCAPQHFAGRR